MILVSIGMKCVHMFQLIAEGRPNSFPNLLHTRLYLVFVKIRREHPCVYGASGDRQRGSSAKTRISSAAKTKAERSQPCESATKQLSHLSIEEDTTTDSERVLSYSSCVVRSLIHVVDSNSNLQMTFECAYYSVCITHRPTLYMHFVSHSCSLLLFDRCVS